MTASKLKAATKGLPGKLLLECSEMRDLTLIIEHGGHNITVGRIDFEDGEVRLGKCPICAEDLEEMGTGNKRQCPKCKQVYREEDM